MIHVRELIHGALENDLSADARRRLDAHLAVCEECRRTDQELRRNDALLSRQDALVPAPAMRPARRRPLRLVVPSLVVVATVALALVAGNALAAWRAGPTAGSPGANTGPVTASSTGVPTPQVASPRPNGLPICTAGQLPLLEVTQSAPPGDQEGAGAASAEAAFRRTYPSIASFTMYPFGSDRPSTDPTVLGHGPVWIVAGSDTYIAQYVGAAGLTSWFAHPATFIGCRDANARPTPTPYIVPLDCASVVQAAVPTTPSLYPTRTAAEVTSGLRNDPYFRHTLEDVAGVRQDANPLRDAGVPRCAVDALRTGDPVFVRSYPSDAGLWYVSVIYGDRQVLLVTVGRNEAGMGASGGSVGGGGGSGGMFPPMSKAKAMQVGGTAADPAASAELVFARVSGAQLVSWRIVRQSGAVFYVVPGYPGAGPDGAVLTEAQVNGGP